MICKTIIIVVVAVIAQAYACAQCGRGKSCAAAPCANALYQVVLDNCGPDVTPCCAVNAAPVCAPAIQKPIVALPAAIPRAKIVGASASCVKTVLKPQLYRQLVSVPVISKYLQTITKPCIEVITFNAKPICPTPCSCAVKAPCACAAPVPCAPAPCSCVAPAPCAPCAPAPCACVAPIPCAPAPCAVPVAPPCYCSAPNPCAPPPCAPAPCACATPVPCAPAPCACAAPAPTPCYYAAPAPCAPPPCACAPPAPCAPSCSYATPASVTYPYPYPQPCGCSC